MKQFENLHDLLQLAEDLYSQPAHLEWPRAKLDFQAPQFYSCWWRFYFLAEATRSQPPGTPLSAGHARTGNVASYSPRAGTPNSKVWSFCCFWRSCVGTCSWAEYSGHFPCNQNVIIVGFVVYVSGVQLFFKWQWWMNNCQINWGS